MKPKICNICQEDIINPRSTLQNVCSMECAIEQTRRRQQKRRAAETRAMRKAYNESDRSYQLKKAQEAFNEFIRLRDRGKPCISCGTTDPNLRYDAGHFRSVGAMPSLRFEETNCFRQCHFNCNINRSGNIIEYRINLVRRIGAERVEWLEQDHPPAKWSLEDIKAFKRGYRLKSKELRIKEGNT